ncbi:MAG: DUF2510 domain-containing protein [Actinomycetota bacterium]
MQEFSSVTASAYDADALTPLLSEKAAEGWEVISIVSAGTNIVAYLQRGDAAAPAPTPASPAVEEPVDDAPAQELAAAETPAPVDEPSGWAQAPGGAADASTADADDADGAGAAAAAATATESTVPAAEPVVAPASEPAVAAEPAAVTAPQEESTVPAGWYADPSGRYELRYWDGSAWTEHVSRAGQQFTDPPVA